MLHHKNNSILKKMLIPMIAVLLIQAVLFAGTILWGGTIRQLRQNAFEILNERVINRQSYLENSMIQHWSRVDETVSAVQQKVQKSLLDYDLGYADIQISGELCGDILSQTAQDIIYMLRKNTVTGAFLVLDGTLEQTAVSLDAQAPVEKAAFYVRDLDPETNASDNSDLLIECAPSAVSKKLGIPMDTWWTPQLALREDLGSDAFFTQPVSAARAHAEIGYSDLGYWSEPFSLQQQDVSVVTYTVPLLSGPGQPFGVLGIEVTTDYLRRNLPFDELDSEKRGSYLLAVKDGKSYRSIYGTGAIYQQTFTERRMFTLSEDAAYQSSFTVEPDQETTGKIYGNVQPLNLYNTNTPFSQNQWVLIGLMNKADLLGFTNSVFFTVCIAMAVSLLIGIIGIAAAARLVTMPITALVGQVKTSNPRLPVSFKKTRIAEVDQLASAIELLSRNVADNASKLSQIIELAEIPIGAFEYTPGEAQIFCTKSFFEIVGRNDLMPTDGLVLIKEFRTAMETLHKNLRETDGNSFVYKLKTPDAKDRWVRLKLVDSPEKVLGVVSDITREMLEKRKIEFERDYDLLTNLLNRRAFYSKLEKLFQAKGRLRTAAMLMMDLDNLKYINDTYGHDVGDGYIRAAAQALKHALPRETLTARMSGDEFYVFLHGYQTREELRELLAGVRDSVLGTDFPLPDGTCLKIRASGGISWYPADAQSYDALIKYADFAMYKVKNTIKGAFGEFDLESYQREGYLLSGGESLNKLIDEKMVEYYFQPIVEVKTGAVFAYEALMRPLMPFFHSPTEVLTIARVQSKLYQIEKLTMFEAMEAFIHKKGIPPRCRVFINSVSNQMLGERDIALFESMYSPYLGRIVIELTEEDKNDETLTLRKRECLFRWGSAFALDDFGAGYNGDVTLLNVKPDYVKIDLSIVRDIDSDINRQNILRSILYYAHDGGMLVIAEGVETHAELQTLISFGVDYLQGYYIGMPARELEPVSLQVQQQIRDAMRPTGGAAGEPAQ